MVSPENVQPRNIKWTHQDVFKNIYLYAHMHAIAIGEEEATNLKESREGCVGGFEGRKRKERDVIKLQS